MVLCKTAVIPLLMHWSYCSLALSRQYNSIMGIVGIWYQIHMSFIVAIEQIYYAYMNAIQRLICGLPSLWKQWLHLTHLLLHKLAAKLQLITLTLYMLIFRGNIKHIFTFHVTPLHWYETGGWNLSSNKTRTYPFYIYYGCWCPGDARSQDTNSYDIDLVKPR